MDAIRTILPKVLRKRGLFTPARAAMITGAAQEWITRAVPHSAEQVRVEKLAHAVLHISCVHSIAAQECVPLLPSLQAYLQREFGEELVQEIRMARER